MKIVQTQIPNHISPEEEGWPEGDFSGYIAWADTYFPSDSNLTILSRQYNRAYRLIEVLDENKTL